MPHPASSPALDRLLLTGAAGVLGTVLRESLRPYAHILRLSDIAPMAWLPDTGSARSIASSAEPVAQRWNPGRAISSSQRPGLQPRRADDVPVRLAPSVQAIWAFDYDEDDGAPHNRRLFVDIQRHPGRPDGGRRAE
ncbi:hypothetical protein GCM10027514_24230 [Azotobacter armeniacus]